MEELRELLRELNNKCKDLTNKDFDITIETGNELIKKLNKILSSLSDIEIKSNIDEIKRSLYKFRMFRKILLYEYDNSSDDSNNNNEIEEIVMFNVIDKIYKEITDIRIKHRSQIYKLLKVKFHLKNVTEEKNKEIFRNFINRGNKLLDELLNEEIYPNIEDLGLIVYRMKRASDELKDENIKLSDKISEVEKILKHKDKV